MNSQNHVTRLHLGNPRWVLLPILLLGPNPALLSGNLVMNGTFDSGTGWVLGPYNIVQEGNPGGTAKAPNSYSPFLYQNIPSWQLPLSPQRLNFRTELKSTPSGTTVYGGVWLYGFITDTNLHTSNVVAGGSNDFKEVGYLSTWYGNGHWVSEANVFDPVSASMYPHGLRILIMAGYRSKFGYVYVDNVTLTTGVTGATPSEGVRGTQNPALSAQTVYSLNLETGGMGVQEPIWILPSAYEPQFQPASLDDPPLWVPPMEAYGFEYEITSGSAGFAGVYLPPAGDSVFELLLWNDTAGWIHHGEITAQALHLFAGLVEPGTTITKFRIQGFQELALMDPLLGGVFPTALLFDSAGEIEMAMTGFIPEPGTVAMWTGCLALLVTLLLRRKSQTR